MSQPSSSPVPYKVVYSDRVRDELKALMSEAMAKGLGAQLLNAVKQIHSRLSIYPQFGEPLAELKTEGETEWVAGIWPLVVRYVIDEKQRAVFVIVPIKPLPHAGL